MILLGVVLLVAFALRVVFLDQKEFGGQDEPFTCTFTFLPFDQIIAQTFALKEPHPVGSYFIQRAWYLLTGRTEFAMRFASVWFSMLSLPLLWQITRLMGLHKPTSHYSALPIVAMALFAINPFDLAFGRIVRMYALLAFLPLLAAVFLLRFLKQGHARDIWLHTLIMFLAWHTHYYALFIWLAQHLFAMGWLLLHRPLPNQRGMLAHWIVSQLTLGLAYLPWAIAVRQTVENYYGFVESPTLLQAITSWLSAFTTNDGAIGPPLYWAIAAAALALLGCVDLLRQPYKRKFVVMLILSAITTPMIVWVLAQSRPIFTPRYLIAALPAFLILIAQGIFARTLRRVAIILSALILGGNLWGAATYLYAQSQPNHDWHTFVNMVDSLTQSLPSESQRVVLNYPDQAFGCHYSEGKVPFFILPPFANDQAGTAREIDKMRAAGVRRIVMQIVDTDWDTGHAAVAALQQKYTLLDERFTGRWIVKIFGSPVPLTPVDPRTMDYAEGIGLTATRFAPDRPAQLMEVGLRLRSPQSADTLAGLKLFIHVTPPGQPQQVQAQVDMAVTPDMLNRDLFYGLRLPAELAPGAYVVRVGFYNGNLPTLPRYLKRDGSDVTEFPIQVN